MGSVYLVRSPGGTPYALKLLDPEMAKSDPDFKVRFMREAEFAMTLHHRNLIPVLDAGEDPELGVCYLLMSYMPGGSVKDRVRSQGRFPAAEAVSIVARIAAALEVAHYHGVVHRDIKPDNILFDDNGTPRRRTRRSSGSCSGTWRSRRGTGASRDCGRSLAATARPEGALPRAGDLQPRRHA